MSSNGFLQILDLRVISLPWLMTVGPFAYRQIRRAVLLPTGGWALFTADGERRDARLLGGWVLAGGVLTGLRWQTEAGEFLGAVTSTRMQTPDVGRRLLARLKWPLPEPAAFA
jgi:hypothetical protein